MPEPMTRAERIDAGTRGEPCDRFERSTNASGRCIWCYRRAEDHPQHTPTESAVQNTADTITDAKE